MRYIQTFHCRMFANGNDRHSRKINSFVFFFYRSPEAWQIVLELYTCDWLYALHSYSQYFRLSRSVRLSIWSYIDLYIITKISIHRHDVSFYTQDRFPLNLHELARTRNIPKFQTVHWLQMSLHYVIYIVYVKWQYIFLSRYSASYVA